MTLLHLLEEIERLSKAATPGPWGKVGIPYYEFWIVPAAEETSADPQKHPLAKICHEGPDGAAFYRNTQRQSNAAYIAAVNPANILLLTSALRSAMEALKPFANEIPVDDGRLNERDPVQIWVKVGAEVKIITGGLCVGNFWNARKALSEPTP